MEDKLKVEIWDDPIWSQPLKSLETDGKSEPLAKLLRAGIQPPTEVLERLGIMLAPPSGYIGPFFEIKVPKRSRKQAMQKLLEDQAIRSMIQDARQEFGNSLEAAIASVRAKTGLSRAKLFECWRLDSKASVGKTQTMLGYGPVERQSRKKLKKA